MTRKILALFVLALFFSACAAPVPESGSLTQGHEEFVRVAGDGLDVVVRFIDYEAGVACWVYNGYHKGGVYCLSLDETWLDIAK
jgi:hypothetical protein